VTEIALVAFGVACITWAGVVSLQGAMYQRAHRNDFAVVAAGAPAVASAEATEPVDRSVPNGVVGLLEIPRLRFSAVVAEGDDEKTLSKAIGHLADTPLPWAGGNSVLAGHRDTHFRALRNLLIGDRLTLKTAKGQFTYTVSDKLIVTPNDVWVLGPSKSRQLTLITCYPFSYVGRAPQRFIVRAEETAGPAAPGPGSASPPEPNDAPVR
jgi:sortase A